MKSLGVVVHRKIDTVRYTREMPSAPDGDYVIVAMRSELTRKLSAVETIIPVRYSNGVWRVSVYTIN